MFNLAILVKYDELTRLHDDVVTLADDFDTSAQAELRAMLWLHYRPNDVVMLLELETAICKNCDEPIEESAGWVVHKWKHISTGGYTCRNVEFTRAEPKED